MTGTIAPTDYEWYRALESGGPHEEVNFWRPSAERRFRADRFSPFLFELKAPHNAICGYLTPMRWDLTRGEGRRAMAHEPHVAASSAEMVPGRLSWHTRGIHARPVGTGRLVQGPAAGTFGGVAPLPNRRTSSYHRFVQFDRIKIVPGVCEGRPTIRGLRLTVEFVLKLLGDGYTADDIVREYPELERKDVFQAAKYGAWLASQRTSAVA